MATPPKKANRVEGSPDSSFARRGKKISIEGNIGEFFFFFKGRYNRRLSKYKLYGLEQKSLLSFLSVNTFSLVAVGGTAFKRCPAITTSWRQAVRKCLNINEAVTDSLELMLQIPVQSEYTSGSLCCVLLTEVF